MSRTLEIVKADALRRLRPFLRREPSRFRPKARAEREAAIRAYLAEVVQAHLFELIGGQVLNPEMDLKSWLERVLAEAIAGADHHPAVAAAEHRDSLFDIVRSGYLAEVERRHRSWEAGWHGRRWDDAGDARGRGGSQAGTGRGARPEEGGPEGADAALARGAAARAGTAAPRKGQRCLDYLPE